MFHALTDGVTASAAKQPSISKRLNRVAPHQASPHALNRYIFNSFQRNPIKRYSPISFKPSRQRIQTQHGLAFQ